MVLFVCKVTQLFQYIMDLIQRDTEEKIIVIYSYLLLFGGLERRGCYLETVTHPRLTLNSLSS